MSAAQPRTRAWITLPLEGRTVGVAEFIVTLLIEEFEGCTYFCGGDEPGEFTYKRDEPGDLSNAVSRGPLSGGWWFNRDEITLYHDGVLAIIFSDIPPHKADCMLEVLDELEFAVKSKGGQKAAWVAIQEVRITSV